MRWLASQSSGVDFLVPGVCGHSLTVSSVGAGAGAGMSSAGARTLYWVSTNPGQDSVCM